MLVGLGHVDLVCRDLERSLAFYAAEMEKRGAKRLGDQYVDDNLVNAAGFGRDAAVSPKDPGRPGVYVAVLETPDATKQAGEKPEGKQDDRAVA